MGIFDSIFSLTGNVAKVVLAPVEIAVDLADTVVMPVADAAGEIVDGIKELKP
jgi:hypothetical protein